MEEPPLDSETGKLSTAWMAECVGCFLVSTCGLASQNTGETRARILGRALFRDSTCLCGRASSANGQQ